MARAEDRDNRSRRHCDTAPFSRRTDLPPVPEGTILRLEPGEWSHQAGVYPSERMTVRVSCVLAGRPDSDGAAVWVVGHRLECEWPASDCARPCVELLVAVAALWRAVGW